MTGYDPTGASRTWQPHRHGPLVRAYTHQPAQATPRGRILKSARPLYVEVIGPLGGTWTTSSPTELHAQAAALTDAARWLTAQTSSAADQPALFTDNGEN